MRRGALALAVAAVTVSGVLPALAETGEPVTGWWSRTRVGAPSPVEAPLPFVPAGGTYVSGGVGGELAVAALRLELADDERAVSLALEVADGQGVPEVEVCPAAARWGPVEGGRYDEAPPSDCASSAAGEVVDGKLLVALEALTSGGPLDVVLRPAQDAVFSLSMHPATAASVTVVRDGAAGPDGAFFAPPPNDPGPAGGADAPLLSDTPMPPLDFTPGGTAGPVLAGELPGLPAPAQPQAAPPAPQAAGPPAARLPTRPSAATPIDDRATAIPAALLLLGMAALAMKLNGTPARAPIALGGAARLRARQVDDVAVPGTDGPARGVGRFRRERSGRPTPL